MSEESYDISLINTNLCSILLKKYNTDREYDCNLCGTKNFGWLNYQIHMSTEHLIAPVEYEGRDYVEVAEGNE